MDQKELLEKLAEHAMEFKRRVAEVTPANADQQRTITELAELGDMIEKAFDLTNAATDRADLATKDLQEEQKALNQIAKDLSATIAAATKAKDDAAERLIGERQKTSDLQRVMDQLKQDLEIARRRTVATETELRSLSDIAIQEGLELMRSF